MKTSLKLLSLLSLTVLVAAPLARAEEPVATPAKPPAGQHARPDPAKRAARRLQQLDEKLHLNDTQKQQITAIWAASEQKGKALRADESLAKEDRKSQMMEIMKSSHDQVRALLTPDQQKTFDAMPPPERGRRGPPHGDDAPPPPKA